MALENLRQFIKAIEQVGELVRVTHPVRAHLEIAEIADRCMKSPGGGPALPATSTSLNQRVDQSVGSRDDGVEARKLIVGRGISLSGEITSCDRLVIEGSVAANLQNCQHVEITETGVFNGNAAIDDIEVSGRFEGDLIVRKRLLIRASGHVSGTITYGEIEIEAGGKISGAIQTHEGPKGLGIKRP